MFLCIISLHYTLGIGCLCVTLSAPSEYSEILLFFILSGLSDAASGLSDGNEGKHEESSTKRYQRRSVRSRSRHDKSAKPKLVVLNVRDIKFLSLVDFQRNLMINNLMTKRYNQ